MFDYVTNAIVRILDAQQKPVGAGCLVRERLVVTCAHVVTDALGIPRDAVEAPSGLIDLDFPFVLNIVGTGRVVLWWPYRQAIGRDRRHDLALLELTGALQTVEPARLLRPGHEQPGPIHVYGFPRDAGLGDVGDWIEGRVMPPLPSGWLKLVRRDQQARFIEPGCSGGPVIVDETGLVAGIVSLRRSGSGSPEAYGISAALIREALNEGSASAVDDDVPRQELAEEARSFTPEPAAEPVTIADAPAGERDAGGGIRTPRQPRIFLAHASEDKPRVRQLYEDLKARGFEPWLDEVDLIPGQVWRVEIPNAIREAGLFLACLSSRSAGKQGYVQSEFRTALTTFAERPPGSIWLIPVKLDECEIPDLQIPDRGMSLRDIHWLDLSQEQGFERLVGAIEFALPRTASGSLQSGPATLSAMGTTSGAAVDAGARDRQSGVLDVTIVPDPTEGAEGETGSPSIERVTISGHGDVQHKVGTGTGRAWLWARFPPAWSSRQLTIAIVASAGALVGAALYAAGVFEDWEGSEPQLADTEPTQVAEQAVPIEQVEEFRDCEECPLMVVVPAGSFPMGSTEAEQRWAIEQGAQQVWVDREKPQREVRIAEPFAIGRYEVTFEEWDACVAGGGCNGHQPGDQDWGRDQRPVINVSWDDAQAYVSWLSGKTGEEYRLPSEAEWEYAARAGTTTRYSWGDAITSEHANYGGNVGKTTEVGAYPANRWGLHDMHGNVWEWVEDCWNDNYQGAPDDGSAWSTGNCSRRVVRGGAWYLDPRGLRSASRSGSSSDFRDSFIGFRVARTVVTP